MSDGGISIGVRSFIRKNIRSVTELEALLLLWRSGRQAWSADDLARQLYVPMEKVARTLEALHDRRLLVADNDRYAFDGENTGSEILAALAAAYRCHLIAVTNLVHANERRDSHSCMSGQLGGRGGRAS